MFEKARVVVAIMGATPVRRRAILLILWLASVAGAVILTAHLICHYSLDDTPGKFSDGSDVIEMVEDSVVTYKYSNGYSITETTHTVRTADDPAAPEAET